MPVGDTVFRLLEAATEEEILQICSLLDVPHTKDRGVDKTNISKAYRKAASSTVRGWFRGDHDFEYKQILIDVADKLKPGVGWTKIELEDSNSEEDVERNINDFVLHRVDTELKKMSPEKREQKARELDAAFKREGMAAATRTAVVGAVTAGTVSVLGANAAAVAVFYSGVLASIWAGIFGPSLFFLIASGAGLAALTTVPFALAILDTPAYRKTVPATLQFILIRSRLKAEREMEAEK